MMTFSTVVQSQPKLKQVGKSIQPGNNQQKITSEIRKQQNRIASKNYRAFTFIDINSLRKDANNSLVAGAKRKRQLQYLQRLIEDGDSRGQHASQKSLQSVEQITHFPLAECEHAEPSSSPFVLPLNPDIGPLTSGSTVAIDPVLVPSTATFAHSLFTTTPPSPLFQSSWNDAVYDSYQTEPMSTWYLPLRMASTEDSAQDALRPEIFHCLSPSGQPILAPSSTASQQRQELMTYADFYAGSGLQYQPSSNGDTILPPLCSDRMSVIQQHFETQSNAHMQVYAAPCMSV